MLPGGAGAVPGVRAVSSRVHGGYARVVAGGAAGGRLVLIALSARRFRCLEPSCPKATFAEQAGSVAYLGKCGRARGTR